MYLGGHPSPLYCVLLCVWHRGLDLAHGGFWERGEYSQVVSAKTTVFEETLANVTNLSKVDVSLI